MGAANPALVIVEFADFECPACGGFEREVLGPFLAANRTEVQVVFHHWPLSYHRFALPAARAAECAAEQGKFEDMYSLLFSNQDSLGIRSFQDMANDIGISDASGFQRCLQSRGVDQIINRDIEAARDIGGQGTPTAVIRGMRFDSPPSRAQLDSLLTVARTERGIQ
jgi:protein-disulfide isomerase